MGLIERRRRFKAKLQEAQLFIGGAARAWPSLKLLSVVIAADAASAASGSVLRSLLADPGPPSRRKGKPFQGRLCRLTKPEPGAKAEAEASDRDELLGEQAARRAVQHPDGQHN